jgi:hypothetical protein
MPSRRNARANAKPNPHDADFARFMQAAQQPVALAEWPFTGLTPSLWDALPLVYRRALDEVVNATLTLWVRQERIPGVVVPDRPESRPFPAATRNPPRPP